MITVTFTNDQITNLVKGVRFALDEYHEHIFEVAKSEDRDGYRESMDEYEKLSGVLAILERETSKI